MGFDPNITSPQVLAQTPHQWQRVFAEAAISRHSPNPAYLVDVLTNEQDKTVCIARLDSELMTRYIVWTLGVDPEPLFISDRGTLNHGRYDIGDLETAAAEAKFRVGQ